MDSSPLSRATSLSSASLTDNLSPKLRDLAQTQERLNTGRRVNRPSDDASAFQRARQLELLEQRYEQFNRTITDARGWLDHTQENLDLVSDVFAEAYQQGVRATNSTLTESEREETAAFLESMLENVVGLLNSKAGEEYMYSGTRTGEKPFAIDGADPAADGANVVYYGNNDTVARQIGPDDTLNINIDGSRLLAVDQNNDGTSDFTATESIQNMIDALRANDVDAMATGIAQIEASRDHFISLGAEIGGIVNRLDLSESQLAESSLALSRQRSDEEEIDLAEAILDFQKAQSSLQTSLQLTGSILQNSLLNFI
ncbi:MAG: flagellin [Rhodothermales bacterium]